MSDPTESTQSHAFPWSKIIHYAVIGFLLIGGLVYWALKPPALNPMSDPMAAEAMALVQTHRADRAPTLRQAITDRVQALRAKGQGVRMGEWRVEQQEQGVYLVRVTIREQITKGWFEREYIWRVNLPTRSVTPLTDPAADLMPLIQGSRGWVTPPALKYG